MDRWQRLAALASLSALVSCSGPSEPSAADIVVTPSTVAIAQPQTQQLTVSVVDGSGTLLSGVAVTFEAADESIATVSNVGLVTSVGPAGSTHLVVRGAGIEKEIPVTVTPVSTRITVTPNPGAVPQMGSLQLDANLLDVTGTPVPGAVLTFVSGTPSIATVSAIGLVTSIGPAGQVTIAISSGTTAHKSL